MRSAKSARPAPGAQHRRPAQRPVIGWREWASLPELGIERIKIKVDTGARTSALHAFNLQSFQRGDRLWVRFAAHPLQRSKRQVMNCELPVMDHRVVTNSGGVREKRYVVQTILRLGEGEWPIDISLTNRDQMGFRMLLGRAAIRRRFVVDAARSYCLSEQHEAPIHAR